MDSMGIPDYCTPKLYYDNVGLGHYAVQNEIEMKKMFVLD